MANDAFLDFIWQEESSKGTNPNIGPDGDYQITEPAYQDAREADDKVKGWTYQEVVSDPAKGRHVADVYFHKVAPKYLKHYGYEDSYPMRIAVWNWGIGNLHKNEGDISVAPPITKRYISRYLKQFEPQETDLINFLGR